jgi:hypothetical protein
LAERRSPFVERRKLTNRIAAYVLPATAVWSDD